MSTGHISDNLWKIMSIRAIRSFMLIIPVIVLFFQENGLTLSQVFLLQSLFSLAVIVFEVPTGYLSDRFGRRTSIIVGCTFGVIGHSAYAMSTGFWGFLTAEIILGFGASFLSGTESALLYDSLREMGRTDEHKRVEGRNTSLSMISESVASILGGALALISLRFPLYCEAVIMLLLIPLSLSIVEPARQTLIPKGHPLRDMLRLMKYALHDHGEIKWLCLYSAVVAASTLTMVWFTQPYLQKAGLPVAYFGAVWAAFQLVGASCSWHAHAIEAHLRRRISLLTLIVLPATGFIILGITGSLAASVIIVLFYVTRGVHGPILSDYINGLIESEIRATVLSVRNLLARLLFSTLGPIMGWLHDTTTLSTALLTSSAVYFTLGSLALIGLIRAERH
ncbi:MAG: MFS transporter [Candidatus Moraniibacteriota bacterium]